VLYLVDIRHHLFITISCTTVLLCAVFSWHMSLTETQTSRMNLTTEQKVDFIIKVIEQHVPPLLWRHYFYVYVQHSIVIGPKFYNILSHNCSSAYNFGYWVKYRTKIKLWLRYCGNLVFDTEQVLQNFWERVGSFAQW